MIICPNCAKKVREDAVESGLRVCPRPQCGYHFPMAAALRVQYLVDPGTFKETNADINPVDPLEFPDYPAKVAAAQAKTGMRSAVLTGTAKLNGTTIAIGVTDFRFIAGAMNTVVGHKLFQIIRHAIAQNLPLLLISESGAGAQMQEGLRSLNQMALLTMALNEHRQKGLLSVIILGDSTHGGVIASWASIPQVIFAEPRANIGFVGKAVSDGKMRFRTAEYQFKHGAVDSILARSKQRAVLGTLFKTAFAISHMSEPEDSWDQLENLVKAHESGALQEFLINQAMEVVKDRPLSDKSLYAARSHKRPRSLAYIQRMCPSFTQLRGDRLYADDQAIVGGLGLFAGYLPVMVIAQQKDVEEDASLGITRNGGKAGPSGYWKAIRLMKMAEELGIPVITLIDTPGADISGDSERRGISYALAECIRVMGALKIPTVSVIIGEGGSGGAIALANGDRRLMQQKAIYSVITPDGCAAILWKLEGRHRALDAARLLKITSIDAQEAGLIDVIVNEPEDGADTDPQQAIRLVIMDVATALLQARTIEDRISTRLAKLEAVNTKLGYT